MKILNMLKRTFALLFVAATLFQSSACFALGSEESETIIQEQPSDRIIDKNAVNPEKISEKPKTIKQEQPSDKTIDKNAVNPEKSSEKPETTKQEQPSNKIIDKNVTNSENSSEKSENTTQEQPSERTISKSILNSYETNIGDENSFFSLISRIRYLNRWVLFQNVDKKEDLADHSLEVGISSYALASIHNKIAKGEIVIDGFDPKKKGSEYLELNADRAAVYGMFHDILEVITGDIPTPAKYLDEGSIKSANRLDNKAADEMILLLPNELREDFMKILKHSDEDKELWKIVKAADTLSALIKCLREKKVGNNDFDKVLEIYTIKVKILADSDPAISYFVKTFMPSFGFKCPDNLTVTKLAW